MRSWAREAMRLVATLAGSVLASAVAAVSFLEPWRNDWFGKAVCVWFSGGLAVLLLASPVTRSRASLAGFLGILAANTVLVVPLYTRGQTLVAADRESLLTFSMRFIVSDSYQRHLALTWLCVAAYAVGPHAAACIGRAAAEARRASRSFMPHALLLGAIVWPATYMPPMLFGEGPGRAGSTFCRTAEDCGLYICVPGSGCYSTPPLSESDFYEPCATPAPLTHCECNYGRCERLGGVIEDE